MGIDAVPMLFLRVRMGATARNRLYTTMQVDYFSTVLDLGQHILLEIDPTDIEYQLRTIQIDHLPGCRLETFRVHTGRNEHFDPKVIADDFGDDPAQRKNRYEDRRPLVGGSGRTAAEKQPRYYQRKYGDFSKHRQIYLPANLLKLTTSARIVHIHIKDRSVRNITKLSCIEHICLRQNTKEITDNTCFINHYIIIGVNADILADARNFLYNLT